MTMKASHYSVSTSTVWLLLLVLLAHDIQTRYYYDGNAGSLSFIEAFVVPSSTGKFGNTLTTTSVVLLVAAKDQDDDEEEKTRPLQQQQQQQQRDEEPTPRRNFQNTNNAGEGGVVDRRGTFMTLLGSAVSFAMGDAVLNVAVKTVMGGATAATTAAVAAGGAGVGLYERVLAFGSKYRGGAIASEELTTWIATQNVAATPEIQAWMAAQRKLQMIRKTTTTMATTTAAVTQRAKATKKAAGAVGGVGTSILEEGVLAAAAATTAFGKVFSTTSPSRDDTTPITGALEASPETQAQKDGGVGPLTSSSKDKDKTKTSLNHKLVTEADQLSSLSISHTTDENNNENKYSS